MLDNKYNHSEVEKKKYDYWIVARWNKRYASREDLAGKDWI